MAEIKGDKAIIEDLKKLGFSDEYVEAPRRLIANLSGKTKTGKTHFALTAPEPIFFIDIDIGTEGVVHKFQDQGKKIYIYRVRIPKTATKDVYKPVWTNLKSLFQKLFSLKSGTVIVDTDSEMYELARLAKFGKLSQVMPHLYGELNNEYREVLRLAYDSPMNAIFIHKVKPKWVNNARTSEYEPSGQGDMEYSSQVNLATCREDTDSGTEFSVQIQDCRQNSGVNGIQLTGDMCNFNSLLNLVHGDEE